MYECILIMGNKIVNLETWEWHGHSVVLQFHCTSSHNIWYDDMRRKRLCFLGECFLGSAKGGNPGIWQTLGPKEGACIANSGQKAELSARGNWGCSLIPKGERDSEEQSRNFILGQSLRKEKPFWTQRDHLHTRKESRQTLAEEGREMPLPLGTLGEFPLSTLQWALRWVEHSEHQQLWAEGAETTEQLTFGDGCETN